MSTLHVTQENFEATLKHGIVLLDWWAAWCGPCRAFAPVFEAAAERHPDLTFGKIDTDEQQGLAQAFQIRSIPTLMVFRDGVLLVNQPGMLPAKQLELLITKVRELDMDQVRRTLAERKGPTAAASA